MTASKSTKSAAASKKAAPAKTAKKGATAKAVKAPKAAAKKAEAVVDRSAAVAATWADKKVAEARKLRHAVKVGKSEYSSVRAAFEDLKLPMERHIRFRREVVLNGTATFEGKKFTLVAKSA